MASHDTTLNARKPSLKYQVLEAQVLGYQPSVRTPSTRIPTKCLDTNQVLGYQPSAITPSAWYQPSVWIPTKC
ncbi:hypothetical protein BgiBS90_014402 [Biomphalaria glabrata]|nr:hypothetical protein BgiBS90_014402 [Biomphalaria glabrata]